MTVPSPNTRPRRTPRAFTLPVLVAAFALAGAVPFAPLPAPASPASPAGFAVFAVFVPDAAQAAQTAQSDARSGSASDDAGSAGMRGGAAAAAVARRAAEWVPDVAALAARSPVGLQTVVERFGEDRSALGRRYDAPFSAVRRDALRAFHQEWLARLAEIDYDALDLEARVDYHLLRNDVEHGLAEIAQEEDVIALTGSLLPFVETIGGLHAARRDLERIDPRAAATALDRLAEVVDSTRRAVLADAREAARTAAAADNGAASGSAVDAPLADSRERAGATAASMFGAASTRAAEDRLAAFRAAEIIARLRGTLENWYEFHHGYDPAFTWWAEAPYARADEALSEYRDALRREIVGIEPGGEEPIVGQPLGREALLADLRHEMIAYSPEELIAIAWRELEWGHEQMRIAAREMGYGDDWRAALEAVKQAHVEPGEQTELIVGLAREAEAYMEAHDLVTVPPLAREVWRMEMLSPERQRVSPFFLGGEVIRVSYPTHEMTHDEKLMSMRGNNPHFSRATVHHELIPGHHLQGFMSDRHFPYRGAFGTPFWSEGNAFYWELLLWDMGFFDSPEDRMGALFWRNHRAARIIFSLSFHLGEMTPEECIDFLVERVGHERANAEAEVRRSFNGSYSPLYQVAYMMGGIQFKSLHEELVESGRMTNREFHDAILEGGRMPVEMVRVRLTGRPPAPDWQPSWRFIDVPEGGAAQ